MQHVAISWWWRRETATGAGVVGAVESREFPANSQSASLMECCKADAMNDDSQHLLLTSPAAFAPSCSSSSIVRHFGQEFQYSLATSHSDDFSDFTVFFLSVLLLLAVSLSLSTYASPLNSCAVIKSGFDAESCCRESTLDRRINREGISKLTQADPNDLV